MHTTIAHGKSQLQKTENLYQEIEQHFYLKPEKVEPCLKRAGVHDLSALLKRWLRELPQPILANDLVHLFYQTHGEYHFNLMIFSYFVHRSLMFCFVQLVSTALPAQDQIRAISMLCLLLPHENRNTMRELLNFFKLVVELQSFNKMSIHNVATITGKFTTLFLFSFNHKSTATRRTITIMLNSFQYFLFSNIETKN